jgi:energy-coupling factor transporter ATP-binding protein EcfA2
VNEAICNPSLIFLDEVTSGLDEQTDCEMMQLFRKIADDGKTIVCVTHSVTYVEQNCDLVAVLAPGGVLAFVGPPAAALQYFGVTRLGDVYMRLSERSPAEWKQRFRKSNFHQEYVARRLPEAISEMPEATFEPKKKPLRELATVLRQFCLLTRRYLAIQLADKKALIAMLGQSLFIAVLLVWLFGNISNLDVQDEAQQLADVVAPGVAWSDLFTETQEQLLQEAEEKKRADYSSKILFLLCISCIWFGCNNAAKEIVKERVIYNKERDVGLNVVSYYGSKLALLGLFSVLQASLLYCCVRHFTKLGGDVPEQWLLLSLSSLAGVGMGLAISAIANTEDFAATIVPISLIPQIVLAGLIAPLLYYTRGFSQVFISAYWAYQGLLGALETPLQDRLRAAGNLDLGTEWTLAVVSGVLMAHVVVFAVAAILTLYARDKTA